MNRRPWRVISLLIAVLVLLAVTAGIPAAETEAAGKGPPSFIVGTNGDPAVNQAARQSVEDNGGKVVHEFHLVNGMVVSLPAEAAPGLGGLAGV